MSGVDLSSERINEIVLDEEGVPSIDKVDGEIISDLKVAVQSEEPLETTVDGVMEGDRVQTVAPSAPKEKLVVARGDVDRVSETWGSLLWLSATSTKARTLSIWRTSEDKFFFSRLTDRAHRRCFHQ